MIVDYFQDSLAPLGIVSFKSSKTLHKKLDEMVESPEWLRGDMDFPQLKGVEFYMQDIIECIIYLASQPAYANSCT